MRSWELSEFIHQVRHGVVSPIFLELSPLCRCQSTLCTHTILRNCKASAINVQCVWLINNWLIWAAWAGLKGTLSKTMDVTLHYVLYDMRWFFSMLMPIELLLWGVTCGTEHQRPDHNGLQKLESLGSLQNLTNSSNEYLLVNMFTYHTNHREGMGFQWFCAFLYWCCVFWQWWLCLPGSLSL